MTVQAVVDLGSSLPSAQHLADAGRSPLQAYVFEVWSGGIHRMGTHTPRKEHAMRRRNTWLSITRVMVFLLGGIAVLSAWSGTHWGSVITDTRRIINATGDPALQTEMRLSLMYAQLAQIETHLTTISLLLFGLVLLALAWPAGDSDR
jgi:uncharacterized membrane protein